MDGLVGVPAVEVVGELHNHGLGHGQMVAEPSLADKAPSSDGDRKGESAELLDPREPTSAPGDAAQGFL